MSIEKEHIVAQEDWLRTLYALAAKQLGLDAEHRDEENCAAIDYFILDAEKHRGVVSTYTHKETLLDSLRILYTVFTSAQVTDDQKTMMALKIKDDLAPATRRNCVS